MPARKLGRAVGLRRPPRRAGRLETRGSRSHEGVDRRRVRSRAVRSGEGEPGVAPDLVRFIPAGDRAVMIGRETISRRRLLGASIGLATGTVGLGLFQFPAFPASLSTDSLITEIERDVLFAGRQSGVTWFHPRPCMVPTVDGPEALMTLQSISGPDVFGPVHWT